MASIRRLFAGCERGAELVEFAFVLPILLVVIGGIVDFGLLFQRYEVVTNAAREGARLASLPGYNESAVRSHVRNYISQGLALYDDRLDAAVPNSSSGVAVDPVTLSVNPGAGTINIPGTRVTVTYQHTFIMLGPVMQLINRSWNSSRTIVAVSQMRTEAPSAGS
jgi:Flp pilus assembly protein TadG